jgi:hypothetical protein
MVVIQWREIEGDLTTVAAAITGYYRKQIAVIEASGTVDRGCVFPDVNGQGYPHWRYQSPGGRRRYVRKAEVKDLQAACDRGSLIKEFERQCFRDLEGLLAEAKKRGIGGDGLV